MSKISSIVITYNEENNIQDCLESLKWTDEIIIIDSKSSDKTFEIASRFTDKIFLTDDLPYYAKKNMGIEKASNEWILSIDADERVTENLKNEIILKINDPNLECNGFYIKRKSFFLNKFIKHCGWYPDYVLRLFRKTRGIRFSDNLVHETLIIDGKTGKLNANLLHYTDKDLEHYINKLNRYTTFSAKELTAKNKKIGIIEIFFRSFFTFFKMYLIKLGFLDGYTGLVLCTLSSFHVFIKYLKYYFKLNMRTNNG